ncbi:MAG: molybdenum cofactor biosynthesis protein MoaE [Gammaproteobacteria bacterium]|jgi:molybdopterin synthase catalytic subunit
MNVQLQDKPLDPWRAIADYQAEAFAERTDFGATASFVGTMRDVNEGDGVRGMRLEHYPGMTESALEGIARQAVERWELADCLIVHRVGDLHPGDPIVLVAVWSAHRKAAFEACRWLMEELKSRVPLWKRETLADETTRWVEKNTAGY